jgi:type I restriction enzyme R subunit
MARGLCEPVKHPRNTQDYGAYFCPSEGTTEAEKIEQEQLRLTLYKSVSKLIRAYGNIANEMAEAGYNDQEIKRIKDDVKHFESVRNNIKLMSGDHIDMKSYEPTMRRMLDTYIHATPSETVIDFEDLGLIELIVNQGPEALIKAIPEDIASNPENVAETIENNVRKTIVDENPVNPKYYEHMSALLDELIELRRQKAIAYAEYLQKIRQLASKVINPTGSAGGDAYPETINTPAKRALYDNLDQNEDLADKVDAAIRLHKQADWQGHLIKERKITNAVHQVIKEYEVDTDLEELISLVKAQQEYQ